MPFQLQENYEMELKIFNLPTGKKSATGNMSLNLSNKLDISEVRFKCTLD